MKKPIIISFLSFLLMSNAMSQKPEIELSFTAINNFSYVQLDSIKISNLTRDCDTMLYWPDTVLVLDYQTGINDLNKDPETMRVLQNFPNPVADQTSITLYVPETDNISIIITDISGQVLIKTDMVLNNGYSTFRFVPGKAGMYILSAKWRNTASSRKIVVASADKSTVCSFQYLDNIPVSAKHKKVNLSGNFSFQPGDELRYIGFANTVDEVRGSDVIEDMPYSSEFYQFEIEEGIPCPGTPSVLYEDQVYNTVQIGDQCWFKENLNIGTMIDGGDDQLNNGVIEKYCYDNDAANCELFGGLYQWREMMQYALTKNNAGICPDGWHIPSDEEWKILEGTVDSLYPVGDPQWEGTFWRGSDAGKNLKSRSGWYDNGNGTNSFGFAALPAGYRYFLGSFTKIEQYSSFWSSGEYDTYNSWLRAFSYDQDQVNRSWYEKDTGLSVRCLKD